MKPFLFLFSKLQISKVFGFLEIISIPPLRNSSNLSFKSLFSKSDISFSKNKNRSLDVLNSFIII